MPEQTWTFDEADKRGAIVDTPHPAQIIDSVMRDRKHAIAVSTEHGLQVETIEVDERSAFPNPLRAVGERRVADLPSFVAELERRPLGSASTLWGNADRGELTAIYNDHGGDVECDDAGWRDDKLALKLAADADWASWHALSGNFFPQNTFGDKIEELLHTVVDPDQADLLEIIDSIRASTSGEFESGIDRSNGAQSLVYKTEHAVRAGRTGKLEVPQMVTLSLRPWDNHPSQYEVQGYFRVRIHEGNLTLAVKLKPTRQIVRAAWQEVTDAVVNQTDTPVYAIA
jgi:hypothetical protein